MILPARNIWDTRLQCLCAVIAAQDANGEVDLWLATSFAHVNMDTPRIIVNPNRLYPIEGIMRQSGRFSLNILDAGQTEQTRRFIRLRRRERNKAQAIGWAVEFGDLGLPFLPIASRTLFCEIEQMLDTGDHTVTVARVNSVKINPASADQPPLRYSDIADGQPAKWQLPIQRFVQSTGAKQFVRKLLHRVTPPAPADLPVETYESGGQTDAEVDKVLSYGVIDHGRLVEPPAAPVAPAKPLSVCVVGTHWGQTHVESLRRASTNVRVFVCGRDRERTAAVARAWKADGFFVGIENAIQDPGIDGLSLAMPHHLHRQAAEQALTGGKHVLVEKPIANNVAEAQSMIDAALRHQRILMVAENMHYRPTLRVVFERLRAGDIGEPLQMMAQNGGLRRIRGWGAQREASGGGVFMDQGIHYVRAMRDLLGEPDQVHAFPWMQVQTKMEGEDGLTAVFSSRYGWRAQISTTCSATLGTVPDLVLVGDKGTIHVWPRTGIVDYYPLAPRTITRMLSYVRPYSLQAKLMHPNLQRERTKLNRVDSGYTEEMISFLDMLAKGQPTVESATEGMRDLEIVQYVYQSMEQGSRPVMIPELGSPALRI